MSPLLLLGLVLSLLPLDILATACAGVQERICTKSSDRSCAWNAAKQVCQELRFCRPDMTKTECELSKSCIYTNNRCEYHENVTSSNNLGNVCSSAYAACPAGEACDFCGELNYCCDSMTGVCNVGSGLTCPSPFKCCAVKPTPSPTIAPSKAPTRVCDKFGTSMNACLGSGCNWYEEDGCHIGLYCNINWSKSKCENIKNVGHCEYVEATGCQLRDTPAPVINEGRNCYAKCLTQQNQPCDFCGTEGVCCSRNNPINCKMDTSVCNADLCCAKPGTWAPTNAVTRSPTTKSPTKLPTAAPTRPITSTPTSSPTEQAPTKTPTIFGSTVTFASSTGQFEPSVHGSPGFFQHICRVFTPYWFPSQVDCNKDLIDIIIERHDPTRAGRSRRLDAALLEPSVDVHYSIYSTPENSSAVLLGLAESNKELRRRAALAQYMIVPTDPTHIVELDSPKASEARSDSEVEKNNYMYIGIGVGCFGLLAFAAAIFVFRRNANKRKQDQRDNVYIPQQRGDVLAVHGLDFRSTGPPTKRDYVAEEVNGVFSISSQQIAQGQPKRTTSSRSLGRPSSQRSTRMDKSASFHQDTQDGLQIREDTLHHHQMAPYFSGRGEDFDDQSVYSDPAPPPTGTNAYTGQTYQEPQYYADRRDGTFAYDQQQQRKGASMSDWL